MSVYCFQFSRQEYGDLVRLVGREEVGQHMSWLFTAIPTIILAVIFVLWCIAFILIIVLFPDNSPSKYYNYFLKTNEFETKYWSTCFTSPETCISKKIWWIYIGFWRSNRWYWYCTYYNDMDNPYNMVNIISHNNTHGSTFISKYMKSYLDIPVTLLLNRNPRNL